MPVKKSKRVQEIPLSELYPFKNHPFWVVGDEIMRRTVESAAQFGVLAPAPARPRPKDGYELVAGRRRMRASELAGLETMSVIARQMDGDTATITVVDSDFQRGMPLLSECAFAYKMRMEAIARRAGRPSKENSGQAGRGFQGKESRKIIVEQTGESARQIQRFTNLIDLISELLDMVDRKEVTFSPTVELFSLRKEERWGFLETMDYGQSTPSLSQAQRVKRLSQVGMCIQEAVNTIMSEEKKSGLDTITPKNDVLRKYFPRFYTPEQMQDMIIRLLEQWQKRRQRGQSRQRRTSTLNRNEISAKANATDVDMDLLVAGIGEILDGIRHCPKATDLCGSSTDSDYTLMVAVLPGKGIQVKDVTEYSDVLKCFGTDDLVIQAPGYDLSTSYDGRQTLVLDSRKCLVGPVILYDVDGDGEDAFMTAEDIHGVQRMIASRTVILYADGQDFPALLLNGEV